MDDFWKDHFVVDVETDGPCPGMFNMVSFGIASVYDPSVSYHSGLLQPDVMHPGQKEARDIHGVSFQEQVWEGREITEAMQLAREWLVGTSFILDVERPLSRQFVMWSDNPAFDFQFVNYYFIKGIGRNPFGHSAHRIGDLWWGLMGTHKKDQWKQLRQTAHDHNPENDARGNAEALNAFVIGSGKF